MPRRSNKKRISRRSKNVRRRSRRSRRSRNVRRRSIRSTKNRRVSKRQPKRRSRRSRKKKGKADAEISGLTREGAVTPSNREENKPKRSGPEPEPAPKLKKFKKQSSGDWFQLL
jgi:hypothetical protein